MFKKILAGLVIALGCFGLVVGKTASAQSVSSSASEVVTSFSVVAEVSSDRMVRIVETIDYDFGSNSRHGIYRDIPTKYQRNGGAYQLRLSDISVQMDGASIPYSVESMSPIFSIKIGDPDKTMTGKHQFVLAYSTDRAINFFNDHSELYWNVTGNEWRVPIASSSFIVMGPASFDAKSAKSDCFTGVFGSTEKACKISTRSNAVEVRSNDPLSLGEGLTVVVAFPLEMISAPTFFDTLLRIVKDNGILVLPFIVAIAMFVLWRKKGREPEGKGTVVPQYVPPRNLAPMEMSILERQTAEQKTITATIIDLARRGYLTIEYGEKKGLIGTSQTYAFAKRKEVDDSLATFERTVFTGLFASGDHVDLEALKGSFYTSVQSAKQQGERAVHTKGYFGANPSTVRGGYIGVGIGMIVIPFWLMSSFVSGGLAIASVVASGIIVAAFGWFMPAKTKEGAIALEEVLGFKWFLSVTEKDRMAFHNAPAVKPEMFHAYLSYAIVFGVEKAWADQFKGLDVPAPDYATGYSTWNTLMFVNLMHSMDTKAASVAYAAPSSAGSGGSGFSGGGSGGGFGGGGGGSW